MVRPNSVLLADPPSRIEGRWPTSRSNHNGRGIDAPVHRFANSLVTPHCCICNVGGNPPSLCKPPAQDTFVELGGIEPPCIRSYRAWSGRYVPGQARFSSDPSDAETTNPPQRMRPFPHKLRVDILCPLTSYRILRRALREPVVVTHRGERWSRPCSDSVPVRAYFGIDRVVEFGAIPRRSHPRLSSSRVNATRSRAQQFGSWRGYSSSRACQKPGLPGK
jgi:hypothetical protein